MQLLSAVASSPVATTLAAGGCAGAVSRTITAPLDRLKVLAQEGRCARQFGASRVSAAQLCRLIYHEGGILSFWRGNGINCLKAGPEFAAAFTARQFYVGRLCANPAKPTAWENFAVGALGGVTAQWLLYPMEVIKTRMTVSSTNEYRSIADCFAQSLRRGGVLDLYRGMLANTAGIIPHRGIEMGLFFTLEQKYTQLTGHAAPFMWLTAFGFFSSIVSQVVTYPLNLVRTRLQTQGVNGRAIRYRGLCHCLYTVAREEGVRGLFMGILPNMLKAVPSSMTMYVVFRETKSFLERTRDNDATR